MTHADDSKDVAAAVKVADEGGSGGEWRGGVVA